MYPRAESAGQRGQRGLSRHEITLPLQVGQSLVEVAVSGLTTISRSTRDARTDGQRRVPYVFQERAHGVVLGREERVLDLSLTR